MISLHSVYVTKSIIIQNPLVGDSPNTSGDGGQELKPHTSRDVGKESKLHKSTSVGKEFKPQKTRGHPEKESKHKTTVANNFMKWSFISVLLKWIMITFINMSTRRESICTMCKYELTVVQSRRNKWWETSKERGIFCQCLCGGGDTLIPPLSLPVTWRQRTATDKVGPRKSMD